MYVTLTKGTKRMYIHTDADMVATRVVDGDYHSPPGRETGLTDPQKRAKEKVAHYIRKGWKLAEGEE